jgi:hypothetical protein
VEEMLHSVKGLVSYTLARSGDGGFSVTVCQDKAGVDDSIRIAKDWIAKNATGAGASPPKISEGTRVLINFGQVRLLLKRRSCCATAKWRDGLEAVNIRARL